MLVVDYQSKSYLRFLNDLTQIAKHKTRFLVTLNGGNTSEILDVAEQFNAYTSCQLQHSKAVIDKAPNERVESLFKEARNSRDILLFESSDLLFEKKTEVKRSHERDNGFDLNNLFKCIAKHNGIVLLATEDKQTLSASMSTKVDVLIRFR